MQNFLDIIINGPARYTQEYHLSPALTLAIVIGALLLEFGVVYLLLCLAFKLCQYSRTFFSTFLRLVGIGKRDVENVFLQLTFPSSTTKSAYATEQLHIIMQGMVKYHGFCSHLAAIKQPYSLELVATRDEGIRYIIMVPKKDVDIVKRTLLSFLPGLKTKEVGDYLQSLNKIPIGVSELKLTSDFVLPLNNNKTLGEHDPIAYLTGYMRNLLADELVSFQIVLVPILRNTHPNELRHIRDTQHRIALNKPVSPKLTAYKINLPRILLRTVVAPFWLIATGTKLVAFVITMVASNGKPMDSGNRPPNDNPYEQELSSAIKIKLDQHLFEVSIRILVASSDADDISSRLYTIALSFNTFTSTQQSIGRRRLVPLISSVAKRFNRFQKRSLLRHIFTQQTILSSSELADIYHFPDTSLTKTEGLVKSRSRDLPAPLSIKKNDGAQFDVVVGLNQFGGETSPIGVTLGQRQKHTYVIGKTGTGKTTMLMGMIYQDMVNGKGVAVFDPHGDMFRHLLSIVPKHRRKDVVVFDPSDRNYPVGLNILDPGIPFDNDDDKNEWITSTVLSVFTKLADEKQWGPRMEHILRSATMTALQLPNPSLYTLQRLLTDKKYQKEVAKTLKDPILKQFWDKEFKLMGSMQMSSATSPLTNRLGHFLTSKMSRHILLQGRSTLRIADIMNEGKILLINLSKGDIGQDQSLFFGTILTSFIWMAAYQRTKMPESKRRDFFVYVDEFQNFATPQFSEIISEGRKFHVSLIVSHQNIAQIEDKNIVKIVAGNANTTICLKASPEDEDFILPYMRPEVEKGDIVNLAPYHFYMKVNGDESEDAFSGITVQLKEEGLEKTRDVVVSYSQDQYGTPLKEVEEYMDKLLNQKSEKDEQPKVTSKSNADTSKKEKTTPLGM